MSADAPASTDRRVAALRHDLRTPLNHIIGYGEMLMEDAEQRGDDALLGAARRIHATARKLVEVIQCALSPAKAHASESEIAALRGQLQAPVQSIVGAVEQALETSDPAAAKDLESIRAAAERLLSLTSEVPIGGQPQAAPVPETPRDDAGAPAVGARLLVVDDNAGNRDVLSRRLGRQGHAVVQAAGGREALDILRQGRIDLALLDIMMPDMDGYQVLETMKADPVLAHIPVIMISALDEFESVVRSIEMGAEDYLPKPFDPVLLRARVGACLEKKRLRDEERRKTEELARALQRLKDTQNQLIVQERLASLGAVAAGIAHEIKNPLNFVTNFAEVALELTRDIRKELAPEAAAGIDDLLDSLDQSVAKVREHGKRADGIVRAMLLHSRGESDGKRKADINALLAEDINLAYHGLRAQHSNFNCTVESDLDSSIGEVLVIPHHISRVFLNIVSNACYAVHQRSRISGPDYAPTVSVSTRNCVGHLEVRIRDNGAGMPPHVAARIFDPFFTTKPAGEGTGLGLSLSYEIVVTEHHGRLSVSSVENEYTEFLIILPKETNATAGVAPAAT